MDARGVIEDALGEPVDRLRPLRGGCIAEVYHAQTASGRDLVAKCARPGTDGGFVAEAEMLDGLSPVAPTPVVLLARPDLLVMEHIANSGGGSALGERGLGEIVAAIHSVTGDRYGYGHPTRIREITLDNTWSGDWALFYASTRLSPMARRVARLGAVSDAFAAKVDRLCERLGDVLGDVGEPRLVHGDLWSGNMLWSRGRIAALIDPLSLYADPEIELAFIDLMGGVSRAFWEGYESVRAIRAGFWDTRVHLYQIVPLLGHEILFRDGWASRAENAMVRLEESL